jgi:3-oxoacyl-[acyl-carrier-protein] synthase II
VPYRAAIVGCAATTALGADLDETWAALRAEKSAAQPWPDSGGWGGRPPQVARMPDARSGLEDDPALRILGRHGEWLDLCARRAHAEARLGELPREEVGLFVALGMVDSPPEELASAVLASRGADGVFDLARFFEGGFRTVHPLWPLSMLANVAVGQVAIGLDLRGDNVVLGSEGDAGARAIGEAWQALSLGTVKAALAGGAAEPISEASLARYDLRGTLEHPTRTRLNEVLPGEGSAVLALEDPASARARAVPILGYVAGHGMAFGQAAGPDAMGAALASAGLTHADVDLVFWGVRMPASPGAARPGDDHEGAAYPPPFVSFQGRTGSLGPAAAALDVACALRTFADGALPPGTALWGRPGVEPPRAPRRAVVLGHAEDVVSALVVEAPSCAS